MAEPGTQLRPPGSRRAASITEAAQQREISVLLSGFGGDSVVSHGPVYLTELVGRGRLGRFTTEARAVARRHQRPLMPLVRAYGVGPFVPDAVWRTRAGLRDRRRPPKDAFAPIRSDVVALPQTRGSHDRAAGGGPCTGRLGKPTSVS